MDRSRWKYAENVIEPDIANTPVPDTTDVERLRPEIHVPSSLIKTCFKEKTFFTSFLGKEITNTNNFDYSQINCDSKLHYNKVTNRYTLLVPYIYIVYMKSGKHTADK
jgi:hypothetical protein